MKVVVLVSAFCLRSFLGGLLCFLLLGMAACDTGSENPTAVVVEQSKVVSGIAEDTTKADSIYTNGRVYTVDASRPWAEAIAVTDGRIVAVASNKEIEVFQGDSTELIELEGKMLMPGIHDMHNHPSQAGLTEKFECSFPATTMDEVLVLISDCVVNTPKGEWIRGGQWSKALFTTNQSPKSILDEISTEHPIFLMDWSVHNAWVNSAALERFGIDANTPDPQGGIIERDTVSGEASGILFDNAAYLYRRKLPAYTQSQVIEALTWSIGELVQFGITSFKEAIVTEDSLKAYQAIDQRQGLSARVKTSLTWKSEWADSHQQEIDLIATREQYKSEMLDTDFAKIMLDGIPPSYTAALLEPYLPSEQHGSDFRGLMMLEYDELIKDVVELDRLGVTVKIHATGDRSLRLALDAFQAAREANGDSGLVHEVSHAQMIHFDDLPRFKQLNVAAEMCPILWYPLPGGGVNSNIGEERSKVWAIRNIVESGALAIYGSDWPAIVPNANPWPGIEAMVTRRDPYDRFPGVAWPEQAVDLETAIKIFTLNGATAAKTPDFTGSIEVGKAADFIVLDRNIFEIPIEQVGDTQVLLTIVNGKQIFKR